MGFIYDGLGPTGAMLNFVRLPIELSSAIGM